MTDEQKKKHGPHMTEVGTYTEKQAWMLCLGRFFWQRDLRRGQSGV